MLTRPLDLEPHLSKQPRDHDVMHWVTVCAILLGFGVLGSPFILAPGLPIGLGGSGGIGTDLPRYGEAVDNAAPVSVVVSFRRSNTILFEGGIYSMRELREKLENYTKAHPEAVMLVQFDPQVSVQDLFQLSEMAKEAGFAMVLIAAEPVAGGVASENR